MLIMQEGKNHLCLQSYNFIGYPKSSLHLFALIVNQTYN